MLSNHKYMEGASLGCQHPPSLSLPFYSLGAFTFNTITLSTNAIGGSSSLGVFFPKPNILAHLTN